MIEIIPTKHHYQEEILYPVDNAQEGFDYYEYKIVCEGNIAHDLPQKAIDDISDIVKNWDEDKIDSIEYNGCVLRLCGDMCYIELTGGDISNLFDEWDVQDKIKGL